MLAMAYHFYVLPRYHEPFQYAWRGARDSLQQTLGLVAQELNLPRQRRDAFTLMLTWENQASFDRFLRTWIGVWVINGMGLPRDAFCAPVQTAIGTEAFGRRAAKRAA